LTHIDLSQTPIQLVLAALVTIIFLPNPGKQDKAFSTLGRRNTFAQLFTRPLVLTYSLQIVLMIGNGVVMAIWSL